MSLCGNSLVREKDSQYLSHIAPEFVELMTDSSEHPLSNVLDLTHLKYRERDSLHDIFKGWSAPFDVEALRDARCRGYYRDRYDYRKNLMDSDFQTNVKPVAGIIHWLHYKEFCLTGVAYETRLGTYNTSNPTLASYTDAKDVKRGTSVQVRGFWGDIINSPYHTFGTKTDPVDRPRLFKTSSSQYLHHETDIAHFNVTAYLSEMDSGQPYHLPPETPEEHAFPYQSPLEPLESRDLPEDVFLEGHNEPGRGTRTADNFAPLSAGFSNVEVVPLSGDWCDVLKKPKYKGRFHRVFVGTMSTVPLLEELGLACEDPGSSSQEAKRIRRLPRFEMPDSFGAKREDCALGAAMARGGTLIFETMKYQAHLEGATKLSFRHRIAQAGHLAGWHLLDDVRAVPNLECDMKALRARDLEKDATDFLRFVVG